MRFTEATIVAFLSLSTAVAAYGYDDIYARDVDDLYARDVNELYARDVNELYARDAYAAAEADAYADAYADYEIYARDAEAYAMAEAEELLARDAESDDLWARSMTEDEAPAQYQATQKVNGDKQIPSKAQLEAIIKFAEECKSKFVRAIALYKKYGKSKDQARYESYFNAENKHIKHLEKLANEATS